MCSLPETSETRNNVFLSSDDIFSFSAQLFINTEMCVNTLMYECTTFLVRHRKDGRNQSSRATYQCHYNPLNSNFVAVRRVISQL